VFLNGKRLARRDILTGTVHYYISDYLGSSNVVANGSGAIENESDFYPFGGEEQITAGLSGQRYKFTGKERDPESNMDYFGARYYGAGLGRWVTADYSENGSIIELPQTLNKYNYLYNRPVYGTDPDGRCPPCVGAIVGGVVEAGFDLGKQLVNNGGNLSAVNGREVGAAALGGFVAGGLAVATGGVTRPAYLSQKSLEISACMVRFGPC